MDRIKFRMPLYNKDGSFKEWFYWGFGCGIGDEFISPHSDYRRCPSFQFTGLQDRKGQDIYEGDFMQHENPFDQPFEVNFNEDWASYELGNGCSGYSIADPSFTVVGNIIENPELITN